MSTVIHRDGHWIVEFVSDGLRFSVSMSEDKALAITKAGLENQQSADLLKYGITMNGDNPGTFRLRRCFCAIPGSHLCEEE